MLFGQISGQHGLRSIETGMNSQRNSFYHLGIDENTEVKRSTLSYANSNRSADLYKSLFETMLEKAQQNSTSHGFRFKNPLYSVDATTIDLCLKLFPWADFRENKGGIKLTVKLDHQGKIPCFVAESNAREHDCKKIRSVPFAVNDIVVFDRGYADYDYFATEKHPGKIIARDPDTGKKITLLANNLKWAASTVSAVYKDRWQIELFFKAIKQNLKIKRFYGNSKNAVMTQIRIALIVYLLFCLLKVQNLTGPENKRIHNKQD
jgi:putative transposase